MAIEEDEDVESLVSGEGFDEEDIFKNRRFVRNYLSFRLNRLLADSFIDHSRGIKPEDVSAVLFGSKLG
jgi:hypothetical protein